jgi:hypothetical protein
VTRHSQNTLATGRKNHKPLSQGVPQGKCADALGVSREHLNRVLNGKRISRSLLRRYQERFGAPVKPAST